MPQDTTGNEQEPVVSQESAGREPKSGSSQDPSENDSEPGVPQGPSGNRVKLAIRKLESGMPHDTLGDIPKVVVPQDPSGNRVKSGLSQDPSGNGLELAMAPGPSDGEQGQGPSQDSPMRELRQRLLRSPMVRELRSVFPQGVPWHKLGKSKDPEPEANPICDSIKAELALYGSRLEIKEKYDDFGKDRDEILKRLDENECPETFKRVSLEELTQKGYLPNWKDSKDHLQCICHLVLT
ncbi:hypothetical protein BASA50_002307 [Batrachochytrium salamandrivorans]|uniref:Uncharacterized protein n=1 Tax=Batrachochytrium salamandrivorans TaxID=1357716 RepID=A0ABQ8FLN1_9FUNG|nr:hypothetical protein BASA50_002307 [Batrachochytrium salamandrivorans]